MPDGGGSGPLNDSDCMLGNSNTVADSNGLRIRPYGISTI